MSTTRSQKRRNIQQESIENVSAGLISPVLVENQLQVDQDIMTARTSSAKSLRVENCILESLRASLKDEITSEFKNLLAEFKRKC